MKASKFTTIDFFDDLTSKYARRRFFGWGVILCVLCVVAIYLVAQFIPAGTLVDVLNAILIEVIAGAVIILAFYFIYVYFIGIKPEVSVTRPQDISEQMKNLPHGVSSYMLWGRSGSFFRSYALLELDKESRDQKKNIDITIVLPDPSEPGLVASYNEICHSLGEKPGANHLLTHVLATGIACAIIDANNKFINIQVFHSKFIPAFRVDLSSNGAILTQDDPAKSALFFKADTEFYEMFRATVRNETSIAKNITWEKAQFNGLELNRQSCTDENISAFGIPIDNVGDIRDEVSALVSNRPHRYK